MFISSYWEYHRLYLPIQFLGQLYLLTYFIWNVCIDCEGRRCMYDVLRLVPCCNRIQYFLLMAFYIKWIIHDSRHHIALALNEETLLVLCNLYLIYENMEIYSRFYLPIYTEITKIRILINAWINNKRVNMILVSLWYGCFFV